MTANNELGYIQWCNKIFSFTFICFSFITFSSLFPTGFSTVSFFVAFVAALPVFFRRISEIKLNNYEVVGLILFLWISMSIFWSDVPALDSLAALSEYRLYLMVPIFSLVLTTDRRTKRYTLIAGLLGASIALFASWGIGLGWFVLPSGQNSLGDRIYHGFVMSVFLIACFCIARERYGFTRYFFLIVASLIFYNLVNMENGRTGYLLLITVTVVFAVLTFRGSNLVAAFLLTVVFCVLSFKYLAGFHDRVTQTLDNVEKMLVEDNYNSSVGYRLEFYRAAIEIGLDNPMVGVGVGDVASELRAYWNVGKLRVLTDNVHSEYLNMLMVGGIPAVLLFALFLGLIIRQGLLQRSRSRWLGDAMVGIGCIVVVATLFNSSIKDYGEKQALIIIFSLLNAMIADFEIKKIKKANL
ncbi:O-antigen ligase family protein [Litoricolaceae bacterium]|nr:O-antigen ligase family protein [Litorivicinaceae bacterium]